MELNHEHRLTQVEDRCKSNQHRIEQLEERTETMNALATNMELLARDLSDMSKAVEDLCKKITAIESKPAKRWEGIVDKAIMVTVGAVLALVFGKIGL